MCERDREIDTDRHTEKRREKVASCRLTASLYLSVLLSASGKNKQTVTFWGDGGSGRLRDLLRAS